jgi:hypothetical protein
MLGEDQPVILHLLDIPYAAEALEGVRMELVDAAYPLVKGKSPQNPIFGRFDSVRPNLVSFLDLLWPSCVDRIKAPTMLTSGVLFYFLAGIIATTNVDEATKGVHIAGAVFPCPPAPAALLTDHQEIAPSVASEASLLVTVMVGGFPRKEGMERKEVRCRLRLPRLLSRLSGSLGAQCRVAIRCWRYHFSQLAACSWQLDALCTTPLCFPPGDGEECGNLQEPGVCSR